MFRSLFGITAFVLVVGVSTHYQSTRLSEVIGGLPGCNSRVAVERSCYSHEKNSITNTCTEMTGFIPSYGLPHVFLTWNLHADADQQFKCGHVKYESTRTGLTHICAGDWITPGTKACEHDYFTFWIF